MLTEAQIDAFHREGYLVIEDVIDEATRLAIVAEYATLFDDLYDGWHADGVVPARKGI